VVNPQLGIRRSYLNETRRISRTFLDRGLETIIFANSRLATEILVTYLKEDFARRPIGPDAIRGYRGGYLPLERRGIERDLREAIAIAQTQGAGTHEAHARARLLELLPHLAVAH